VLRFSSLVYRAGKREMIGKRNWLRMLGLRESRLDGKARFHETEQNQWAHPLHSAKGWAQLFVMGCDANQDRVTGSSARSP
jgi:hypothetical protein